MKKTTKAQRLRARAVLLGPTFRPVVDRLDGQEGSPAAVAMASTVIAAIDPEPERIVHWPEAIHMAGLSRSAIKLRMASDTFPARVSLDGRRGGWKLSALRQWLRERQSL